MKAIIETGSKQFKVAAGDVILIEKIEANEGDIFTFDRVLGIIDGEKATFGKPLLDGAKVTAEVMGNIKGKKLIVFKYKSKKGFRKKKGHRQPYTKVKISEISA